MVAPLPDYRWRKYETGPSPVIPYEDGCFGDELREDHLPAEDVDADIRYGLIEYQSHRADQVHETDLLAAGKAHAAREHVTDTEEVVDQSGNDETD